MQATLIQSLPLPSERTVQLQRSIRSTIAEWMRRVQQTQGAHHADQSRPVRYRHYALGCSCRGNQVFLAAIMFLSASSSRR
jgi:hypothetical protein